MPVSPPGTFLHVSKIHHEAASVTGKWLLAFWIRGFSWVWILKFFSILHTSLTCESWEMLWFKTTAHASSQLYLCDHLPRFTYSYWRLFSDFKPHFFSFILEELFHATIHWLLLTKNIWWCAWSILLHLLYYKESPLLQLVRFLVFFTWGCLMWPLSLSAPVSTETLPLPNELA